MNIHHLNALRLGFSTQAASALQTEGVRTYIDRQLTASVPLKEPKFIAKSPKSLEEVRDLRKAADKGGKKAKKANKDLVKLTFQLKAFILQRCSESEYPLREKINLFFQNHFVVTVQSVKLPIWIFQHYRTINMHSLSNYKTLVKEMVYSNAMIKYLDNHQNKKGNINENLGRELLELFTLGEGNYTESDIKNTALALAGLTFGKEKGAYRPGMMDTSTKTVFGKSGNYTIDEVIDIIFEQPNTAYFLAEKVLKWFFYDNPPEDLITRYGALLKGYNFELKPFFQAIFSDQCENPQGGNQIKNPMTYLLQIHHDLGMRPNYDLLVFILKNQGMDIYDQPNVKGWKGGKDWLTSQIYGDRNQLIDFIVDGNPRFEKSLNKRLEKFDMDKVSFDPKLSLTNTTSARAILDELTAHMIFETNEAMDSELNQLLSYDFDPNTENAHQRVLNVYQYLAKSPEFQIV